MISSTQYSVLNALCPMHVVMDSHGVILQVGPTLKKVAQETDLLGRKIFDAVEIRRPKGVTSVDGLCKYAGQKLHLVLRDKPTVQLKAVAGVNDENGHVVMNLSFGINVVDAVGVHNLTSADFAPTDLTVEMLYLVEAKTGAMNETRDLINRLQVAKVAAEEQAYTDTLTGLKNRRALDHILARLVLSGDAFALMQMDLDYFKAVNDTLGHAAGDHVLQKAAEIMVDETRSDDIVARVGGDEFVIVLKGMIDPVVVSRIADRIIARLEQPIPFNDDTCKISSSAGTALAKSGERLPVQTLMDDADVALYASKRNGRAQHTIYDPALRLDPSHLEPPAGRAVGP